MLDHLAGLATAWLFTGSMAIFLPQQNYCTCRNKLRNIRPQYLMASSVSLSVLWNKTGQKGSGKSDGRERWIFFISPSYVFMLLQIQLSSSVEPRWSLVAGAWRSYTDKHNDSAEIYHYMFLLSLGPTLPVTEANSSYSQIVPVYSTKPLAFCPHSSHLLL